MFQTYEVIVIENKRWGDFRKVTILTGNFGEACQPVARVMTSKHKRLHRDWEDDALKAQLKVYILAQRATA